MAERQSRAVGRRQRHGIPVSVPLPKFLKPANLRRISERKQESPGRTWPELIREEILKSAKSKKAARPN